MNCPFCAEEIKDEAVVCKHCGRDLSVVRPVLERIKSLAGRVESLEADKAAMARDVFDLRERVAALELRPAPDAAEAESGPPSRKGARALKALARGLVALALPILALLAAHGLTVILLDLRLWVIRGLSLSLPLAFALALPLPHGGGHRLRGPVLGGLFIAIVAVAGMITATGLSDGQPVLPQDAREWREVVEYMVSIWLSYLTGSLVSSWLAGRKGRSGGDSFVRGLARRLAELTSPQSATRQQIEKRVWLIANILGAAGSLGAALGSIYTGLRRLWE